ncbi:MAG: adenylate/guanylate cyclase domain-containing protein, partial [Gammaproteobacteria bacterium]|nr:adenylate/guanylate cyclase domain-containing protein [Gammaproteobacteria bacterium]
ADVAGYSRLTGADEDGTHRALSEFLDLISDTIEKHNGRVVHYAGDAVLADFATVTEALESSTAIQRELARRNGDLPDDRKVQFRVGVNLGEVIVDRDDIYGDGVNVAARLESLADPGGICISESVRNAAGKKLDLRYEFMGQQGVKNIEDPVRAYRVVMKKESTPDAAVAGLLEITNKPSIAVLPFDNMSKDPEQDYFADGISEDLITALSKIRHFLVIARNSTFTYKGQAVDVKRVGEELGVRYVIEGSVRKAGSRVRISVQLVDATTGHHVWAERYDRALEDIFELQDEMTQTIAGAVEPELNAAERERAVRFPPESLNAWELYQRGLWHLWNFSPEDLNEARRLFQKVHEVDPAFATAYAFESYANYLDVMLGFSETPEDTLEASLAAARNALALDDKDPVAYFALGRVYMMRARHDDSVNALVRALELSPSLAQAHHGLGFALTLSGRLDEAVEALETAIRLSPRDPILWGTMSFLSVTYNLLGEYEAAARWARKAVDEPRAAGGGYWSFAVLASALGNLGKTTEARKLIAEALERKPDLSCVYLEKTLPTKHAGGLKNYLEGLSKAGLPP